MAAALALDELCASLGRYLRRQDQPELSAADLIQVVQVAGEASFYPERLLSDAGCITLVDSSEDLVVASRILTSSRVVAIDVERDWYHSYRGRTCLVQVATAAEGGHVFLLDALKLEQHELGRRLRQVFESPEILKVFHAASNDLRWLFEDFSCRTRPFLDTQLLTARLGLCHQDFTEQWAVFGNILASKGLKKRLQRSDWRRRPLLRLQEVYAATDAYALLPICGGLLRLVEGIYCKELHLGWSAVGSTRKPPKQILLVAAGLEKEETAEHETGDNGCSRKDGCIEWTPPSELLKDCSKPISTFPEFWEPMVAAVNATRARSAPNSAGLGASSISGALGKDISSGLRRALRVIGGAPRSEFVEASALWRQQEAAEQDQSVQFLLPDEVLARAMLAKSDEEARAALETEVAVPEEEVPFPVEMPGDNEQVARRAHLESKSLASFLELLTLEREGRPLPGHLLVQLPASETLRSNEDSQKMSKWWLPFDCEERFWKAFRELPQEQQRRVMQEPLRKRARFLSFVRRVSVKGPVYENCTILAPDGNVLCTVDRKKLQWYVRRELADFLPDSETVIKLRFEPRGRYGIPGANAKNSFSSQDVQQLEKRQQYYTSFKANRCVACGSESNLARYNLVPSCYRSFLPNRFQPGSHDVLLLCVPCHHRAALQHGNRVKKTLAEEIGVKPQPALQGKGDDPKRAARMSALGLLKGGDAIPEERIRSVFLRILDAWKAEHGEMQAAALPDSFLEEVHKVVMDESKSGPPFDSWLGDVWATAPSLCHLLTESFSDRALEVLFFASQYASRRSAQEVKQERSTKREQVAGREVVETWSKRHDGDLTGLIRVCRAEFLETMRPNFLPDHWDVSQRVAVRRAIDLGEVDGTCAQNTESHQEWKNGERRRMTFSAAILAASQEEKLEQEKIRSMSDPDSRGESRQLLLPPCEASLVKETRQTSSEPSVQTQPLPREEPFDANVAIDDARGREI